MWRRFDMSAAAGRHVMKDYMHIWSTSIKPLIMKSIFVRLEAG